MGLRRKVLLVSAAATLFAAVLIGASPFATSVVRFVLDVALRGELSPGDGREQRLLQFVLGNSTKGSSQEVLDAVDRYAWTTEFFMNVGDVKGKIVKDAIANMTKPPTFLLELGTYCGYGAITIASALPTTQEARLFTVEPMERNCKVAQAMIAQAGLEDSITILPGTLSGHISTLKALGTPLDFVFLDHVKELYVSDLQLLLHNGLLGRGAVVVADNVRIPGAPEYYKFMEESKDFVTQWHYATLEYSNALTDIVGVSIFSGGDS